MATRGWSRHGRISLLEIISMRSTGDNMRPPRPPARAADLPFEVRELELEDLPAVFALGEKLFTAEKWPNLYRTWDEYEITEMFAIDGDTCLVAEMNGRIIGFALGTLIEKRRSAWTYGYLLWLGVDPDCGRSGVASRLVARLTDLFIEAGARMILADTDAENAEALSFFRRQGFGNESAHVYLTRNLTSDPGYKRHRARRSRESSHGRPRPKPPRQPAEETAQETRDDQRSDPASGGPESY
jgi:ribosomal protein S18 acetylase RimI-like enzyme